jgi:hypothetical protein
MCARSGGRSPFVRVRPELILVAVPSELGTRPAEHNQYVSVLFMEEGALTVKADVLKLAGEIHLADGFFSPPGLMETAKFVKAAVEPLSILHSLGL